MAVITDLLNRLGGKPVSSKTPPAVADKTPAGAQQGSTVVETARIGRINQRLYVNPALRAAILDLRRLDKVDGRVKTIHRKTASMAVKGGIKLHTTDTNDRIQRLFKQFVAACHLDKRDKLKSDIRSVLMEGNLCLQWVLDPAQKNVVRGVRMPTETIKPLADDNGVFPDPSAAYAQLDPTSGRDIAVFPLWQLTVCRLDPENYDDHGAMGRPWLDAVRETLLKLRMTETDLVVRRNERAPLRTAHVLEGASNEVLQEYKERVEDDQKEVTTNYYMNTKGAVTPVQGDENLDHIKDILYLLDAFFAGSPGDKAIFGYTDGLNRDILEDLLTAFYDELDALQDCVSTAYQTGFELHLLLNGINPDSVPGMCVKFAERRTETANQATDRALKVMATGASQRTVWETAGLNADTELSRRKVERASSDPYPNHEEDDEDLDRPRQRVSITPGNAPKKESATHVTN